MRIARIAMIGLLIGLTISSGCRRDDAEVDAVVVAPGGTTEPSEEQSAAIERIRATGAEIELSDAGVPVRIDLASERVFADEELVRAALLFPNLKGIRLAVSSVSESTLADLSVFTRLEEFFLQDAEIGDAKLRELIQAMPSLKRLTLRRLNQITDETLEAVAGCRELEVVALIEMNQLTGAGLERLADMPRLRSLDVRNCGRLTADDFNRLSAFDGLVELKLGGPAVNDDVASVILGLPELRSLTIEDAEISPVFLEKLASDKVTAERIRTLAFARCFGVTDESLGEIDRFSRLATLSLRDIMISGEFLTRMSEAGKGPLTLKTLIVTNAFLDDAMVRQLPKLIPNLEYLDLRGNPGITEESASTFEKLKSLRELKLE